MKVYISGKITGNKNWKEEFKIVEDILINKGYSVLSPRMITAPLDYEDFMHIDFAMIDICDIVVFLGNASESLGSDRERKYAQAKNIKCIDLCDFL